jgi:diguanylate cyclase (GGDEF)-like protein
MDEREEDRQAEAPMRDTSLRFVQRTALLLLLLAALAAGLVATLHWLAPSAQPMDRVVPALLSLLLAGLSWRQWRYPERMAGTLWISWGAGMLGIALPVWWCLRQALAGGAPLVQSLPPVPPVFLISLVMMALFARPRHATWATVVAWLLVAVPVLAYLVAHPTELWTSRGLELLMTLGPLSLFVPFVIPLMRGIEQRFQAMHHEGERLQALAERDVLVGLYNRRAGERFLGTLLAHGREDAVLILFDIDHFKRINDSHGHPAGDAVLVEVGRRCAAQLSTDDIFARWGGEEFMVVLPGVPRQSGLAVAERLREAIHAVPIAPAGQVSASFGVTAIRADDTLPQVLQRADDALYRAKAEGRNRVVSL